MLGYRAWQVFRGRDRSQGVDWLLLSLRIAGLVLVMVTGAGLVAMHYPEVSALPYNNGGLLGAWVAQVAEGAFNYTGGTLMLRSEEHTSELQSRGHLVCRLLLEKKKQTERGIG